MSTKENSAANGSPETPEQPPMIERLTPESVLAPVRTVSFWAAITMPFLYLPLLFTGIGTPFEVAAFLALVALNVAALVAGHSHHT